ncbi:hypothetical protein [Methylibium sp. Root1272]|uniref:hypothetical protein n=1 Tax=Methylibium sp. Root1272 TaxID=1736441 RepID=UPI0006F98D60|nr:hypothetical protein [Methylibium sp. Root1272]KQW68902.1 hypothetical protein ASC67_09670 [Methylibium sp. Root1272]
MNRNDPDGAVRRPPAELSEDDVEQAALPTAEALLAGTLALMTGVVERAAMAQPLAAHGQSLLMAAKVRKQLGCLSHHPQLSEGFRLTLHRLRVHWDRLTPIADPSGAVGADPVEAAQRLWHRAPGQLQ